MGDKPKPHVVLVPFPAQGHVAPLMQLARVLHARGFHITFVQTELHYRRLLGAKGEAAVASPAADFRVEVVPDGLSLSEPPRTLEGHLDAMARNCLEPFKRLLRALPGEPGVPPVSAVVADVAVTFAAAAARQLGLPDVQFFTASACGLMGHLQYEELIRRGLVPLKGKDYLTDGSLDTPLDWVPGMKGIRLKDMPTFCRATDPDDALLRIHVDQMRSAASSCAIILNTFYDFEKDVLDALAASFPTIYTIGPLASLLADDAIDVSLWQEDAQCLAWLDGKEESSVVYVNFGSLAVMTAAQTRELARGLAECGLPFLWVMRPDMVDDVDKALPGGFLSDVGGRGLIVSWCPQAAVLRHPSLGLFVTHCGWNSLLEAVVGGVPVLGWPVMAEQTTNCRQASSWWGNGAELPREVESGAVARLVREMMAGRLGKEKRERAMEWKRLAEEATKDGGSSWNDIARLVDNIRLKRI